MDYKTTIHVLADMKEDKRNEMIELIPEGESKKAILQHDKEGYYKRCPNTDFCKLAREKKEKEEIDKANLINTLTSRNQVLEDHARIAYAQLSKQEKDLVAYKKLTEARFEKLTNLFLSLNK